MYYRAGTTHRHNAARTVLQQARHACATQAQRFQKLKSQPDIAGAAVNCQNQKPLLRGHYLESSTANQSQKRYRVGDLAEHNVQRSNEIDCLQNRLAIF